MLEKKNVKKKKKEKWRNNFFHTIFIYKEISKILFKVFAICRLNVAVYKFAYYEILPNAVYSHIHYQIYDLSNIFYKKL